METKVLEIIKDESEKAGVRKYTCINGFGYSQFERNIADRIVKLFAIPDVRHSCLKCSNYVPEGCEGVATHREPYCLKTGYYQLRTFPFKNTKCKHYNCA